MQEQYGDEPLLCECLHALDTDRAKNVVLSGVVLDGAVLKDIPAQYHVPTLLSHEMPVVGVYIDPRVATGYKYRVRPLDEKVRYAIELSSF